MSAHVSIKISKTWHRLIAAGGSPLAKPKNAIRRSMNELSENDFEKCFDEILAKIEADKRSKLLRKDHPWVYDIIKVLIRRPNGLSNQPTT